MDEIADITILEKIQQEMNIKIPFLQSNTNNITGAIVNNNRIISLCIKEKQIKTISKTLELLRNLTSLKIICRNLVELNINFSYFVHLQELYLKFPKLKTLNPLNSLPSLKFLRLELDEINIFPFDCKTLLNLESVELSCKILLEIPSSISFLNALHSFMLICEKLPMLPLSFYQLENLTRLELYQENLEFENLDTNEKLTSYKIPEGISQLKNLKSLIIKKGLKIFLLNDFLFISNLEQLDLSHNLIIFNNNEEIQNTIIPEQFIQLKNLKYVNFSFTNLQNIPNSLVNLTKIEVLNLENNLIQKVQNEIMEHKIFKKINLNANPCNKNF